ncbi:hypothetical protein B0H67DRAFT_641540 [Lasiosphaeris hirsuta]|uniref:Uncharacterized protein n=1 Tax=Lasiosphaeris hirsuta TaxID=260670 RepID=A0AA40AZU6_9PEZI|nr:hypothetical protein B0H67DRAFT_641540 [Lasiosphaeris hirsuta]
MPIDEASLVDDFIQVIDDLFDEVAKGEKDYSAYMGSSRRSNPLCANFAEPAAGRRLPGIGSSAFGSAVPPPAAGVKRKAESEVIDLTLD